MMFRTTALVLLLATQVSAQCSFDGLRLTEKGVTFIGQNILLSAGYTAGGTSSAACIAGGTVVDGDNCQFNKANYVVTTTDTATCTGTVWSTIIPTFNGDACPPMVIMDADTVNGVEGDVVGATCIGATSCLMNCDSTCTGLTWTPDFAAASPCIADCPIPFVTGASINTPCIEGTGTVADTLTCVWVEENGYTCMMTGTQTCATGADLPSPTCTENFCTAFALNTMATGYVTGPAAGAVLGCTDMVVLGPVSNPTCTVKCDDNDGYVSASATVSCGIAGGAPTWMLTCTPVTCTAPFDHTANGIVDPMGTLTSCNNVRTAACSLTCDTTGYTQNPMGPPTLLCQRAGATDVGEWSLSNPCIGPATCDIYTCPDGYAKGANPTATLCPAVDPAATPQCTAADMNNDMACCPTVVACPANSAGAGVCTCNPGYTGTPQWSDPAWTHTCVEIACTAYTFTVGQVGGTSDPCTDGIILSAVVDTQCNVACDDGYVDSTGQLQCSNTGILTGPGVACVEKQCAAYNLPAGVVGGTSGTPCTNGMVLSPVTTPSCAVMCAPGYTGTAISVICPASATNGAAPTGTISCVENECAAYTFPTGVIGGMGSPCTNNGRLTTNTNSACDLQCATGYSGTAGQLTCPFDANNDDVPTGGITCMPTCSTHSCSVGYAPLGTPSSVVCTGGTCNDALCCTEVLCPDNSAGVGVCNCDNGWNGFPIWNTATRGWDHTCIPHCANTFFGGCTAGTVLIPDPSLMNCTGTVGCDMNSCPQCTQGVCCDDLVCQPPGNSRPEYIFSGGNTCTTATDCGTITCAVGYSGTPTIICNTANGMFSLGGCNVVACPAHASGAGMCNCDTGYAVTGGGGAVWNTMSKTWTHVCEATCDNPLFTACTGQAGLVRKSSPEAIFCTGSTDDASVDCTADVCCDATCNGFSGCTAMGLSPKNNIGAIRCANNLASSCNVATCCDSTCDNAGFTSCNQVGYQLKLAPDTLSCNGSSPADCTTDLCCDATDCVNFACAAGSRSNPLATTCNGVCNHDTCCIENECAAVATNDFPWYVIPGRPVGCNTETTCGTISCSSGYHPNPFAELKCLVQGGTFTASGCLENNCTGVGNLMGYTAAGGNGCNSESSCGDIRCAAGYNQGSNIPQLICAIHNGAFQGAGCSENVCLSPDSTPLLGYVVATPSCTVASSCGAVQCALGFTGSSPIIACQSPGNAFNAAGCIPNTCSAPLANFPGYDIQDPYCTTATTCGNVICATGYTGTASIVCVTSGSQFTFSGCSSAPCPAYANGTDCACNVGYTGTPSWNGTHWAHTCAEAPCPTNAEPAGTCNCKIGSTGTPVWNPTGGSNNLGVWTHTCLVAMCPANSDPTTCECLPGFFGTPAFDTGSGSWTHSCVLVECLAPSNLFPGYVFSGGNTCTTVTACGTVTCADRFVAVGTPSIDCMGAGLAFNASGCQGVPCPTNAGPDGVCTCFNGYTGTITWTGTGWSGTCSSVGCPSFTDSIPGQCNCARGYTGFPTWDGSQWTHTCSVDQCPQNSQLPDCDCDAGYTGTPTWITNSGWSHGCLLASCPTGASGSGCVCGAGYTSNPSTPQWNQNSGWTHTCTPISTTCTVANSIPSNGQCVCANGYTGQLACTGTSCTGVCTSLCTFANSIPSGSVCVCRSGFTGISCSSFTSCTGSCTQITTNPCAAYANTVSNSISCQCATGFSGNLACTGFSCTGSCSQISGSCAAFPNTEVFNNACRCVNGWSGITCNGFSCTGGCSCVNDVEATCSSLTARCAEPAVAQACCLTCQGSSNNFPRYSFGGNQFVAVQRSNGQHVSSSYLVNVDAGQNEASQVVTTSCSATNPSIFSSQPELLLSGSTATLRFTPVAVGTSTVTCTLTDNGSPVRSTAVTPFQIQVSDSGVGTNLRPCDNGACKFALCASNNGLPDNNQCNTIEIGLAAGAEETYSSTFVVNMNPGSGETSQTVSTTCVSSNVAGSSTYLYTANGAPTVNPTGLVNFSVRQVGTDTLTCTARDSLGATTLFTIFVRVVLTSLPTPPGPVVNNNWLRAFLKLTLSAFSKANFERDVLNYLRSSNLMSGVIRVLVQYVCPKTACSSDGRSCPTTHDSRIASGCVHGSTISSRYSQLLQSTDHEIVVDFDIETANNDGSTLKQQERETARTLLATDFGLCTANSPSCTLGSQLPTGNVMLTDVVTTNVVTPLSDSDDDDSWEWWVWLLIALGAVLLLCCLIALLWFCCRDNDENEKKEKEQPYEGTQMQTYPDQQQKGQSSYGGPQKEGEYASYNDYNYTSAGSEDYYSSYEPTSYAEGGEVVEFVEQEAVRALYIDGQYYDGTIWSKAADGTYNIRWYDGSHSEGVPPEQIQRK